jgi:hypothetical protein
MLTNLKSIIAITLFATVASGQILPDRQTFVDRMNQGNGRAGEFRWATEGPAKTTLLIVVDRPITPEECKQKYGSDFEPNPRDPLQFNEEKELGFSRYGVKCTTVEGKSYVYSIDLTRPGQTPHFTPEPPPEHSPRTEMNSSIQTPRVRLLESQEHMDKGFALQSHGDQKGAIVEYRLAISLDPSFAKPHNNLGNALLSEGDRDGAIREFRRALRLDPYYKMAHFNLANTLSVQGDVKEADEHYLAACPNFPSRVCPASGDQTSSGERDCDFGPGHGEALALWNNRQRACVMKQCLARNPGNPDVCYTVDPSLNTFKPPH